MGVKIRAMGRCLLPLFAVACLAASSSNVQLAEAVKNGDKEAIRVLLKEHADVNIPQRDGTTALAWAAYRDDVETAEILIRAGANVAAANDYGITPLSLACANGSTALVEKLLKAGAPPNARSHTGETPLMTCAKAGNVDTVKLLLAHGAEVDAQETRRGQTALMWAVAEKHPDTAQVLIEHGANVHARSKSGFTALLFAAQQGDLGCARILLAAGANGNDATPQDGSALVVATASGHEEFALFLLDKRVDPNATDGNGIAAMHHAVQKGISIVGGVKYRSLVAYSFQPNMHDLVKALLAHGANPNARIVKAPLRSNYKALVITPAGATPFLLAASTYDVTLMKMLVAGGADPLMPAAEKTTPLMFAAGIGAGLGDVHEIQFEGSQLEAVKLAVELGADVNAVNDTGQTAMHSAAYVGADEIIQFLADKGAKVDVSDKYGQTPLTLAQKFIPATLLDDNLRPRIAHPSTVNLLRKLAGNSSPLTDPASPQSALLPDSHSK